MASSSAIQPTAKTKKRKYQRVLFWSAECKYSVVLNRVDELGWKQVDYEKSENKANVFWIDVSTINEHFRHIQPWQIINHFPGMPNIARKNRMGQNLNRMLKLFPKEYAFYPRTWILPGEMADFRAQFDGAGNSINNKIFIIKPDTGCQGRGIFLTRTIENVPTQENVVAQQYIKKPLLIDGFKFDLRLYCFITSVKPLRMYLYHDGLVRLCTEEYVKPSKQNLNNITMHLTNYAVNKNSENFSEPTDATGGDNSSKRSLVWFMDWIRADYGDQKADWLWKRMGTLCTRTILAVMPTLSRDYDQHFKSFNGIPVDLKRILNRSGYSTSNVILNPPSGSNSHSNISRHKQKSRKVKVKSGEKENNSSDEEDDDDQSEYDDVDEESEGTGDVSPNRRRKNSKSDDNSSRDGSDDDDDDDDDENKSDEGDNNKKRKKKKKPTFRGSRCFEVLGFDVMLDSHLNPWLIEVNHLPSFGTDTKLDLDVKEKLMTEVFSVLPVLPDDQLAYMAFHKVESEKRLNAQRKINETTETNTKNSRNKENNTARRNTLPPKPLGNSNGLGSHSGEDNENEKKVFQSVVKESENGLKAPQKGFDEAELDRIEAEKRAKEDKILEVDEDCTPERINEIKIILADVYQTYSPEKVNKIDRLLSKYVGHEEEFLRFVFGKYDVDPGVYPCSFPLKKREIFLAREERKLQRQQLLAVGEEKNLERENEKDTLDPDKISIDPDSAQNEENEENTNIEKNNENTSSSMESPNFKQTQSARNNNQVKEPIKRFARSLSPPRSGQPSKDNNRDNSSTTRGRSTAAWKGSGEEDAAFRTEVLATHVPEEDDVWLKYEQERLPGFTQIFPVFKGTEESNTLGTSRGDEDGIEEDGQNENDENENENEAENGKETGKEEGKAEVKTNDQTESDNNKNKKSNKFIPASYEEIMYQVFLQDKRQTMRLRCPLPNRAKSDESQGFLPPLDPPSSSRSQYSSMGNGKGVVGWKAPPKPNRNAEPLKQPTQMQSDAAKRLSQGLSVTQTASSSRRQQTIHQQQILQQQFNPAAGGNSMYSVVLDPQEQNDQQNYGYYNLNSASSGSQNGSGSPGNPNGNTTIWPSTKAARLLEESRINRMKLEAAKANSAAVLRQQVFFFDPTYEEPVSGIALNGQTLNPAANPSGLNTNNPNPLHSNMGLAGSMLAEGYGSGGQGNGQNRGHSDEMSVGGSVKSSAVKQNGLNIRSQLPLGTVGQQFTNQRNQGDFGGSAKNGSVSSKGVGPVGQAGKARAGTHASFPAGNGQHTQEELLRQLFPSWF